MFQRATTLRMNLAMLVDRLGRTADFLVYGQGQQRRAVIEAVRLLDNENKGTNSEFCKLNEMPDVKSHNQFKDKSKKWLKFVTQLSDLMGNLKTYELEMLQNKKPNDKGIALQSKQDTNSDEDTEKMEESIALLTKNFNRVLNKFNKFRNKNKSFSNNQGSPSFAQNQSVNPKKKGNPNLDGIQCYECKGNGHIQSECPNYLRRKNKTYVTTLSDDSDSEEENNTNFVAFFTNHEGDDESKEDMQDLLNSYTQLHSKWEEIIKVNLNLMQENHFLKSEKENEILLHKETQEKLMKSLKEEDKLLQEIRRLTENVVQPDLAKRKDYAVENREVLQHHFQHRRRIRCYYCHILRHIKAHCYKRQNDLHNIFWAKQEQKPAQRVWLCEDELRVEFSKENCKVYNQGHECVMMGKRSSDKCYTWDSHLTCNQVTINQTLLWHQRMGHINFHDMKKELKRGAYRGVPKLDIDENRKCDACLENKMTRSSHKRTPGVHTSRIMELLHMDLFEPTQTESIGGKRTRIGLIQKNIQDINMLPVKALPLK
nr:histone H2B.V2-like [Ipomoea batatas]